MVCFLSLFFFFCHAPAYAGESTGVVLVITVNGVINPVSADFIQKSITKANTKPL